MVIFRTIVIVFLGRNTGKKRFLDVTAPLLKSIYYELGAVKEVLYHRWNEFYLRAYFEILIT